MPKVAKKPVEVAQTPKSQWGKLDLAPTEAEAWERARRWAEENRAFIESHNRYVEEHGAFGEGWRHW